MLLLIILASIAVSLTSLIGIITLVNTKFSSPKSLISLAAGSLLAVSFLDLLPEALEHNDFSTGTILSITLISFLTFFLLERILHWHHCHCKEENKKQNVVLTNLIGDGLHNLIDGFLIAAAFLLDIKIGLVTTTAIILHEIPQEIADFSILIYAGFSKAKAIFYNLLFALTAVFGAIIFYFFGQTLEIIIPVMAAVTAGNFIYLSAADLIPELHHEKNTRNIIKHTVWLIMGVVIFAGLKWIISE